MTLEIARTEDVLAQAPERGLRVGVVGPLPWWVRGAADDEAGPVHVASIHETMAAGFVPDVLHVGIESVDELRGRRRRELADAALVVDATGAGSRQLGRRTVRACSHAQALLVRSRHDLREVRRRYPSLGRRTFLLTPPVDLDAYGSEAALTATRGRELKRFRRFHRLAGPTVLFAGEYTESGGLDLAIEAVLQLREDIEGVRLAALPFGEVDGRFLDRCERRALALGHHGIVEHRVEAAEIPLWFAVADVVVFPSRDEAIPIAVSRALAAGRPVVATETEPLLDVVVDGETGILVPTSDSASLAAAVGSLLADEETATALGAAARAQAERELAPDVAAARLRAIWMEAAEARAMASAPARPAASMADAV
ncbi:MAG TPA: glycosyltransferase family 4 protein [Gaiellaceae bacterium]|nr:glycosyltransferase family 4 protein [Gaiellaceae bacterium]